MRIYSHLLKQMILFFISLIFLSSCANRYQNTTLGLTLGQMPINEIEQTYYLGVFDPKEQIPPQVYRIRMHGQSSLGGGKFASGWVPAELIDTLNLSELSTNEESLDKSLKANSDKPAFLQGRKLTVFGPEGFRKVPKGHRLVMVMGNNANQFFDAVSSALGGVSEAKLNSKNATLTNELFKELTDLLKEKQRLANFNDDATGGQ